MCILSQLEEKGILYRDYSINDVSFDIRGNEVRKHLLAKRIVV